MSASSSLEDLIVKQTCRFINCKFDTASNEASTDPNNPSDLYSLEFMNALFNDPERNICKILKKQISDHRGKRGYNNSEKRILLDFFRNVVSLKSHPAKQWTDLQHYLYFVYRYCMASKPDPEQKYLSPNFVAEARSIMSNLMKEDQVQLCLRVFSLIREYTVFAQVQHEKISDIEASIENLFYYYEAFLSATKNLCKIFPELEKLILNIYKLGWLDLNTSIFMYYFYETTYVQNVVRKFEQMKDNVTIKTTGIYTVLTELHKLWRSQMLGINSVIANKLGVTFKGLDNKMMAGHKNILSKNFWIDRSDEEKSRQDMALFDYQLFTLVGNKGLSLPDPTLDGLGECICEDCLIIKYRCLLNNSQNKFSKSNMRVSCRSCQQQVDLHHFQQHIHGHDNSELNHFKHLSNKKKYNLTEKNKEILRDPDPKIANEPPVFPDAGSDDGIEGAGKDGRKNDTTDSENSSRSSSKTGDSKGAKTAKCSRGTNTSNKTAGMTFPCGHSCKLEEELKSEFKKAYQDTCDHHKESKKCDCTFCEVFGSSSSHVHKTNETRNRLRIRLNQRNEKVKLSPKAAAKLNASKTLERKEMPVGTSSHRQAIKENVTPNCRSENVPGSDMNDIHGLLNFIEGTYNPDKIEVAGKKAAKKARQKMKREHERQEQEREERKIQAEIKRREEAQRRSEELARQLAEKARAKEEKKKKQKFKREQSVELMEQTIPAMVTIKRVAENNDSLPTVTITLKGSTPDQDKLLFTLVNGHGGKNAQLDDKKNKTETMAKAVNLEVSSTSNGKKKNKNKDKTEQLTDKMVTKELRLTLAVDPAKATTRKKNQKEEKKQEVKKEKKEKEPDFNIPMLKLPPGITITKVDGPMADRNYKANVNNTAYSSSIPVSKSGVIVVDTEKLIKQSNVNEGASSSNSKKSRKKKKKQEQDTTQNTKPSMVTLKNPIFQNARPEPEMPQPENNNQQASIFTNENGMVTIRSSRLQQSLPVPMANLLSGLKPVLEPKPNYMSSCNFADASRISPFNAQEILSGLPGIEITKVDKNAKKTNTEKKSRTAEVSIIPTTNGDKFNFDKDDLHYDNVFTPKDILEDDMDAEELELEAFKRFCQQSVPPKRKEKVAHLNVKDIVLKKKNDKVTA